MIFDEDLKMLIGEFQHNIDAKGRVFIPAKLREDLGSKFVVSKGLDNCLFVYSLKEWQRLENKIKALPMSKARQLRRFFFAGASEVEPDKQGRVVLAQGLREYANLEKDVVIVGVSTHVEIWDKTLWNNMCENITSDSVAQAMDEIEF